MHTDNVDGQMYQPPNTKNTSFSGLIGSAHTPIPPGLFYGGGGAPKSFPPPAGSVSPLTPQIISGAPAPISGAPTVITQGIQSVQLPIGQPPSLSDLIKATNPISVVAPRPTIPTPGITPVTTPKAFPPPVAKVPTPSHSSITPTVTNLASLQTPARGGNSDEKDSSARTTKPPSAYEGSDGSIKYRINDPEALHTGNHSKTASTEPKTDIEKDGELGAPTIITQHAYDIQVEDNFQNSGKAHIHMWCLDRESNPSLIRITNFPVFTPVQLPAFVDGMPVSWDESNVVPILKYLKVVMGENAPIRWNLVHKTLLHYYQGDEKTPFLLLTFPTVEALKNCTNLLAKPRHIRGIGNLKLEVHENYISIIRKMLSLQNTRYAQWFRIIGREVPFGHELRAATQGTKEKPIREYISEFETLTPISPEESKGWISNPRILSIDGETYSNKHNAMPNKYDPRHPMYMLSCVYQQLRMPETRRKILICIGGCNPIKGAEVRHAKDEFDLVRIFADIVVELDPEVITGYNTFSYDYPYLDARIKARMLDWPHMGRLIGRDPEMTSKSWKSGAYGHNSINNLVMEGRINIDMLPIIRRDYKLDKYDLDFVSKFFIKKGKHDIKSKQMFVIYEQVRVAEATYLKAQAAMEDMTAVAEQLYDAYEEMARVGAYCLEDSVLPIELFEKLNVWIGLIELSCIVGVTILELFTRGQQVRCLSQIYDLASSLDYVIDKRSAPKLFYNGGFVGDPKPGLYDNIICLDFASLYPSIMMAYNICYTTLVKKEMDSYIPDSICNVNEFDQEEPFDGKPVRRGHVNDDGEGTIEGVNDDPEAEDEEDEEGKKTVTRHYRFRFVKREVRDGILPQLVRRLVDERNAVKGQIKVLEKEKKFLLKVESYLTKNGSFGDAVDTLTAELAKLEKKDDAYPVLSTALKYIQERIDQDFSTLLITVKARVMDIDLTLIILDKRQNALKVSANSMYGFLGAQDGGVLPLIEGAMSVTAWGRKLIKAVNEYIETKYGGIVVYGDTDSSMVDLHIKDSKDCNAWGRRLMDEISGVPEKVLPDGTVIPAVSGLFPPPLRVEFEKAMRILCIKKKKYAAYLIKDNGEFQTDRETGERVILKRGIMVARRDNCKFARDNYIKLLRDVLDRKPITEAFNVLAGACSSLLKHEIPPKGNLTIIRELGADYKQPGYFMKVFADELKRTGKPANSGDRLEYVVVRTPEEIGGMKVPLGKKMRAIETWEECQEQAKLRLSEPDKQYDELSYPAEDIDATYYIEHVLMNPLDQLFSIGYMNELVGLETLGCQPQNSHCHFASIVNPIKMMSKFIDDLMRGYSIYAAPEKDKYALIAQSVDMLPGWFSNIIASRAK